MSSYFIVVPWARERCRYRSGLGTNGRVSGFMTGKDVIRQVD